MRTASRSAAIRPPRPRWRPIMTALYFACCGPRTGSRSSRMPAPVFHAIQYLFGNQTREKLENFRGFGGAQSYPSRTKDVDDVDFSTGSVGLGVARRCSPRWCRTTSRAKGWGRRCARGPHGRAGRRCRAGRGQYLRGLLEGWKHGLRNTWWVVDYNRQSLDGVVREGCGSASRRCSAFGWDVVIAEIRQAAGGRLRRARRRARCATGSTPAPTSSIRR
jgi:pyruvate dehydrogenase E1 component